MQSVRRSDGVPSSWRRVRVVVIRPAGFMHIHALSEIAETLLHGFQALGCEAELVENVFTQGCRNVVIGAHLLNEAALSAIPADTVVYNFEQASTDSKHFQPDYLSILRSLRIWDYSVGNIAWLARLIGHGRIQHVPVGYVPQLSRIVPAPEKDIDVLFYGSVNDRRRVVLEALRDAGLVTHAAFGVYGVERDALIARARIVLNMHFYPTSIHEIVRTSYLLSNRKAVVTEAGNDTEMDAELRRAVAAVSYDALVPACMALVRDDARRHMLEETGFAIFSRRNEAEILLKAMQSAA